MRSVIPAHTSVTPVRISVIPALAAGISQRPAQSPRAHPSYPRAHPSYPRSPRVSRGDQHRARAHLRHARVRRPAKRRWGAAGGYDDEGGCLALPESRGCGLRLTGRVLDRLLDDLVQSIEISSLRALDVEAVKDAAEALVAVGLGEFDPFDVVLGQGLFGLF